MCITIRITELPNLKKIVNEALLRHRDLRLGSQQNEGEDYIYFAWAPIFTGKQAVSVWGLLQLQGRISESDLNSHEYPLKLCSCILLNYMFHNFRVELILWAPKYVHCDIKKKQE
jgi:hypothetical protein